MTITLLLDLDDTLLGNKMERFIPAYLQALAKRMSTLSEPSIMTRKLLSATNVMLQNNDPGYTLAEVFDAAFYPSLGLQKEDALPVIDAFYAEDFPNLRSLTQSRPESVELVERALELGYQIAIATNPLFPRTAILQRLSWAGLPPEKYPFELIPSYDTFHFAKPNPAYFTELLAQIGWPEGPVIMVGDDRERDINSALQVGLAAYWITDQEAASQDLLPGVLAQGKLEDLLSWVSSLSMQANEPQFQTPPALQAILRATPAALSTLSKSLPKTLWNQRPKPEEWALTEIFCHLRDVDKEVNLPRMEIMMNQKNPFLPGRDTDSWAEERHYLQQDGVRALQDFTVYRQRLLDLLANLQPEAWNLPARHAIFGPTQLQELVNIIAEHDRLHTRQVLQGSSRSP